MFKISNTKTHYAIFMALLAFAPAYAKENAKNNTADDTSNGPLAPLYNCIEVADSTARLACYDKIANEIKAKEIRNEIISFDAPKIEQIRKESFGFSVPTLWKNDPKKSLKSDDDKVTLNATRIARGDKAIIYFDNGQVWQLTESSEVNVSKNFPIKATIAKASLGSYILSFEGRNKGYRVKRVE